MPQLLRRRGGFLPYLLSFLFSHFPILHLSQTLHCIYLYYTVLLQLSRPHTVTTNKDALFNLIFFSFKIICLQGLGNPNYFFLAFTFFFRHHFVVLECQVRSMYEGHVVNFEGQAVQRGFRHFVVGSGHNK